MVDVYWDASALVKRYASETGTPFANAVFARVAPTRMMCLSIGTGEVVSAFVRKRNAGLIDHEVFVQALVGFRAEVIDSAEFIQGIVNLGTGDRFDADATEALSAGTYSSMPPKMTHFAWMKGETILQLSSIGPWKVVYVNPTDDPRNHAR